MSFLSPSKEVLVDVSPTKGRGSRQSPLVEGRVRVPRVPRIPFGTSVGLRVGVVEERSRPGNVRCL